MMHRFLDPYSSGCASCGCVGRSPQAIAAMQVMWNGEKLPVGTFEDYCKLYLGAEQHVYHHFSDRWEICVAPTDEQGFQQVGLATVLGQHLLWAEGVEGDQDHALQMAAIRDTCTVNQHHCARTNTCGRNYGCNECTRSWLTSSVAQVIPRRMCSDSLNRSNVRAW